MVDEDKLAIQEVIAQYSYTYDAHDAEGFAAQFTEDAVWELFAADATHPATRLDSAQCGRTRSTRTPVSVRVVTAV